MLRLASGPHWSHLAQGAVFAVGARQRAGNMAPQTEIGCQLLCGLSAQRAARLCEEMLSKVTKATEDAVPAYEVWRRLIGGHLQRAGNLSENLPVSRGGSEPSSVQRKTPHPRPASY